jgi:protein TonB
VTAVLDAHRRLEVSLAVSAALHVVVIALLAWTLAGARTAPVRVLPVSLITGAGGAPAARAEVSPVPSPEPVARPAEPARPRRPAPTAVARASVSSRPRPPALAAGGAAAQGGGQGAGTGSGDGEGGGGAGGAGAAYGTNPLPPYPLVARRLGMEGVVLLEVLVAADGRASAVRVARSSGFAPLDASAVTTVRERWRFVPARRGGTPVESRVTVPIRFRLEDAPG